MRVLVPLDESELARRALTSLAPRLTQMNAEVVLLRVLDPRAAHQTAAGFVPREQTDESVELPTWGIPVEPVRRYVEDRGQALSRARISNEERLTALAAARLPGLKVSVLVEWSADAAEAIVGAAATQQVDFIAMGTHGRPGLGQALLGSVAGAAVRTASVPVILVNPHVEG